MLFCLLLSALNLAQPSQNKNCASLNPALAYLFADSMIGERNDDTRIFLFKLGWTISWFCHYSSAAFFLPQISFNVWKKWKNWIPWSDDLRDAMPHYPFRLSFFWFMQRESAVTVCLGFAQPQEGHQFWQGLTKNTISETWFWCNHYFLHTSDWRSDTHRVSSEYWHSI